MKKSTIFWLIVSLLIINSIHTIIKEEFSRLEGTNFVPLPIPEETRTINTTTSSKEKKVLKEIKLRRTSTIPNDCNNPGALRLTSIKEITDLAIGYVWTKGKSNGRFLVFSTPQDGFLALDILLKHYEDVPLWKFIKRYAPKVENNTQGYLGSICERLKVSPKTLVGDCNQIALARVIADKEGFKNY